jgi:hypothetical protein
MRWFAKRDAQVDVGGQGRPYYDIQYAQIARTRTCIVGKRARPHVLGCCHGQSRVTKKTIEVKAYLSQQQCGLDAASWPNGSLATM